MGQREDDLDVPGLEIDLDPLDEEVQLVTVYGIGRACHIAFRRQEAITGGVGETLLEQA